MPAPRAANIALVEHLDDALGRLLRTLEETGLERNTLVVFSSDNGGVYEGDIGPLKGGKTDLHEGGIRGVRFNFVKHLGGRPDFGLFHKTVDRLNALGWHLILHLDANDIVEFEDMFRKLPVPMVLDHMARVKASDGMDQKPFKVLLDFMKDDKVWVKICGSERVSSGGPPFHDAIPFAQALIQAAPDRILWGTDWPHPNVGKYMPNDGDLVDMIPLIMPDAAIRQKVLVENPARLYGFE